MTIEQIKAFMVDNHFSELTRTPYHALETNVRVTMVIIDGKGAMDLKEPDQLVALKRACLEALDEAIYKATALKQKLEGLGDEPNEEPVRKV